jgi:hypothetical protein
MPISLYKCFSTTLVLTMFAWTSHAADIDVQATGPVVSKTLPSGSGMTWHAGKYFVVGDDSPYLFTLNRQFAIVDKTLLQDYPLRKNGRIAKKIKPDHEAMATVAWNGAVWNLILGSGSKKGTRESGLLIPVNGKSVSHAQDMAGLYRDFAALAGFAGQPVNIEGVAVARDAVYFFNRGNAGQNMLFKVALADLMAYMTGQASRIADIRRYVVKLPRLEGREAGLSGADHWPEIDSLVYSASVEGTDNAYDDGAVLGSFLGLIPLSDLDDGAPLDLSQRAQRLLSKGGVPLKTKVESIALTHTGPRQATAALVSDNDDGTSEFFDVVLSLKAAQRR